LGPDTGEGQLQVSACPQQAKRVEEGRLKMSKRLQPLSARLKNRHILGRLSFLSNLDTVHTIRPQPQEFQIAL
jgi:hypothetical protein